MGFGASGGAGGDISSSRLPVSFLPVALGLVGFWPKTWALPLVGIGPSVSQPQLLCSLGK